jgi:uncharacterized protein YciI
MLVVNSNLEAEQSLWVVLQSPGPNWQSGAGFDQQIGIDDHRSYLSLMVEEGNIVMAGDFTHNNGAMLLIRNISLEAAQAIVEKDPLVASGVLVAEFRSWAVDYSTMKNVKKRKLPAAVPKGSPFKIGSPNPEAPINLEQEP